MSRVVTIGYTAQATGIAGLVKRLAKRARRSGTDRHGYIRPDGGFAIEPVYHSAEDFSAGVALVADTKGYHFIDASGEKIYGPFQHAGEFHDGVALVTERRQGQCLLRRDGTMTSVAQYGYGVSSYAGCDRIEVTVGKYVGYLDAHGRMAIPPAFSEGCTFREDRAAVKVKRKWGAIDPAGNMVVEPVYDESFWFHDGVARVEQNGRRFIIDRGGIVILRPEHEPDGVFCEGLASVRRPA